MWGNGRKWGGFGRFCAGFSFSITHSRIHAIPHRSFVFFVLFVVTQKYSPPFPPRPHRSTPQKPPIFTHFSPFSPRFPSFRPFFDVFRQHSCAFAVQKIAHSRPLAITQFPPLPLPLPSATFPPRKARPINPESRPRSSPAPPRQQHHPPFLPIVPAGPSNRGS